MPHHDPHPYRFRSLEDAQQFLSIPSYPTKPNPEKDKLHIWPYIQSPDDPKKIIPNPEHQTAPYELRIVPQRSSQEQLRL